MSNIALNKPILESVWERPEELTNGNYNNYDKKFGYSYSKWPSYLTVDLQDIFKIETIRFLLWDGDQRVYKYRLLTSSDSINWTVHFDTSERGYQGWQEFYFPEKMEIRYIRIHCLWNSVNFAFHIVQLQAFDSETEELKKHITNKRIIVKKPENIENEINDGLPLTQKLNNQISSLERILNETSMINSESFQEFINNMRIQAYDIESLEKSIDSVRREIINPVKNELDKSSKLGRFSVLGFYVGFAGLVVSIFSILNLIFKWIE